MRARSTALYEAYRPRLNAYLLRMDEATAIVAEDLLEERGCGWSASAAGLRHMGVSAWLSLWPTTCS